MYPTAKLVGAAAGALLALGVISAPASAADQIVTGTTTGTLALTAGPAVAFTSNFTPGGTATASGLLTATNTASSSTLKVGDAGTGAGKMVAATGPTCTGSDATLTNPLNTTVTGSGVTSSGKTAIPAAASAATVATASAPIGAAVLTTAYEQVIPSAQVMLTGCAYSLTATYTLQ